MGTLADKLRYLLGTKDAIKAAIQGKGVSVSDTDTFRSYASKIGSIKTTPKTQTKSVTITSNGTTTVNKDSSYDGMTKVTVTTNVPASDPNLQTKTVNVTRNGSQSVTPDSAYDGLSKVDIVTNVPSATLQSKSVDVTSNGSQTIGADSGSTYYNLNGTYNYIAICL